MHRRPILLAALLACWFFALPVRAAEEPLPVRPPTGPILAIYGDSLADGLWHVLSALYKKEPGAKIHHFSKVGAGLARPDWPRVFKDIEAAIETQPPLVAIIWVGVNDQLGLRDEARKGYLFGSPGWRTLYQQRGEQLIDAFEKHGTKVIWLGLPVFRGEEEEKGARIVDAAVQELCTRRNITYIPLDPVFRDAQGRYTSHVPDPAQGGKMRAVRTEDGTHFTYWGYESILGKALTHAGLARQTAQKPSAELK